MDSTTSNLASATVLTALSMKSCMFLLIRCKFAHRTWGNCKKAYYAGQEVCMSTHDVS